MDKYCDEGATATRFSGERQLESTISPEAQVTQPRSSSATIDMDYVAAVAGRADASAQEIRSRVMAPNARKVSPAFTVAQAALLCGLDAEADGFIGSRTALHNRRATSVSDARDAARHCRGPHLRPESCRAITIAVSNFKGGVGKTTTAMTLAQGLSLRGHKVLAIDLDPQGSLTTLFGVLPQTEVDECMTALPVMRGEREDMLGLARTSYWDGVDFVAAAPMLFAAEAIIPNMNPTKGPGYFWSLLDRALESAREAYDVIVIDTPPSLSFLTINGLMAADGIVIPTAPTALDFGSLAHFWQMFADFRRDRAFIQAGSKQYAFIHLLLSRVDQTDVATSAVRAWINATYRELRRASR